MSSRVRRYAVDGEHQVARGERFAGGKVDLAGRREITTVRGGGEGSRPALSAVGDRRRFA